MSAVAELLMAAAQWFVPPHDADPVKLTLYRWRITAVVCALAVAAIGFATWFFRDYKPTIVTQDEFVSADKQIQDEIAQWIKTSNDRWGYEIRNSVLQMAEAKCALPVGSALRQQYNLQILDGTQRYRRVTGDTSFSAPACGDL